MQKAADKLNPGEAPVVPLSKADLVQAAAKQGLVGAAGLAGHHLGGGIGAALAGGGAEALVGKSTLRNLAPKTAAEIPLIQEKTPNFLKQLLEKEGGQGLSSEMVPNLLRQLLSTQASQEQ